jgi:hypothetical protein
MLRKAAVYVLSGTLVCGLALTAEPKKPDEGKAAPGKSIEVKVTPPAEGGAPVTPAATNQMRVQFAQQMLGNYENRVKMIEEGLRGATDPETKAIFESVLGQMKKMTEALSGELAALEKGDADTATAKHNEWVPLMRPLTTLERKCVMLMENQAYLKAAGDDPELKPVAEKYVKASMAVIKLQDEMTQRESERSASLTDLEQKLRAKGITVPRVGLGAGSRPSPTGTTTGAPGATGNTGTTKAKAAPAAPPVPAAPATPVAPNK